LPKEKKLSKDESTVHFRCRFFGAAIFGVEQKLFT